MYPPLLHHSNQLSLSAFIRRAQRAPGASGQGPPTDKLVSELYGLCLRGCRIYNHEKICNILISLGAGPEGPNTPALSVSF